MKILTILLFVTSLVYAAPDTLRYEKMTLNALVTEVLYSESTDRSMGKEDFKSCINAAFHVGETSESAYRRALRIAKRYPYCVHVILDKDAPEWGLCIFRFTRDGDVVSGKEELWIQFATKNAQIDAITWHEVVWDL